MSCVTVPGTRSAHQSVPQKVDISWELADQKLERLVNLEKAVLRAR